MSLLLAVPSSSSPSFSPIQANSDVLPLFRHRPLNYALNWGDGSASLAFRLPFSSRRKGSNGSPFGPVLVGGAGDMVIVNGNQPAGGRPDPTAEDLEYISQIKRVLTLLKKNRDMLFGEVKLTIMLENPREAERRRLLEIDDDDAPTRDELASALEDVNEGRVPENRVALRMLAEEMINWPNLEVEPLTRKSKRRSPYAKATDTGVNPQEAAERLNINWDAEAENE